MPFDDVATFGGCLRDIPMFHAWMKMSTMRDALLAFIAELRSAGVRISVAESMDAMRAVAAVGLIRARMREALAATLIKDEADRVTYFNDRLTMGGISMRSLLIG